MIPILAALLRHKPLAPHSTAEVVAVRKAREGGWGVELSCGCTLTQTYKTLTRGARVAHRCY